MVNMHIGSSFTKISDDAPPLVIIALTFEGPSHALVDWLTSGVLARLSSLRIALSEGQVGWMPFLLERLDEAGEDARGYAKTQEKVPDPPRATLRSRTRRTAPPPSRRKPGCRSRRPGGCWAATRSRATGWTATALRIDLPEDRHGEGGRHAQGAPVGVE